MPRPLIEAAYRGLEAADSVANAIRNARRGDELPLPPMRLRARIGSRSAADFLSAGKSGADALRNAARKHLQREIADAGRILDFGCGCGRTLRHFAPTPVDGCDVDALAIAWMKRNIAAERFAANRFDPPLPWFESAFDLVYSISIFTHLDETSQRDWLREIARVLKPGGHLLIVDLKRPTTRLGRAMITLSFHGGLREGVQDLAELMHIAGFTQVQAGDMRFSMLGFVIGQIAA